MGDIILSKTIGAISTKDYILPLLRKAGLSNIVNKKEKKYKYKFSFSFVPCLCKGVGLFKSDNSGIFLKDLFVSIGLGASICYHFFVDCFCSSNTSPKNNALHPEGVLWII